jgi:type II secretory ATPase GspE/PulE/Tfp pilus assembly ATPase PilB-like protein/ActR/RegA family two-component response regulator
MGGGSPGKWPDGWVVDALRAEKRLDSVAEARLAGSGQPTAWKACVEAGVATSVDIVAALSRRFGIPVADMSVLEPGAVQRLPGAAARRLQVIPLRLVNRTLEVACCDPAAPDLESHVAFAAHRRVRLFLTDPATVGARLDALYPTVEGLMDGLEIDEGEGVLRKLAERVGDAPLDASPTQIVDALIVRAIRRGASDVHLEPHDDYFGIRYRIDGVLHEVARIPPSLAPAITSRVKVLANLDIADRMRPQDGRAHITLDGRRIDLRVSTLPVGAASEKTVVRVLDAGVGVTTLSSLGYRPEELRRIEYLIGSHEGLVLVTGPTGSGKTTTLYAALRSFQTAGINIVTVEDPVEYRLAGISQVQVNERAGLTFSSALRSILRQDPDVVLVGEIRDAETAEIAVQASLTGHVVLSTVHANDAPSTIARLVDIGVDSSGLASALKGVVAQRLLRRLCPTCRVPCDIADLADAQRQLLRDVENPTLYVASACDECGGTGYRGRMVVSEIALVTAAVERAITTGAGVDVIAEHCVAGGMRTFWESGLDRVASGDTSLNELLDNIYPPMPGDERSSGTAAAAASLRDGAAADTGASGKGASDMGESAMETPDTGAPRGIEPPTLVPTADDATALGQTDVDAIFGAASRMLKKESPGAVPAQSNDRPCVLLIDDDAVARREFRVGLEREGFRVVEAADGQAGVEYIRRVRPDFVVTELILPKLDGFGVLRALDGVQAERVPAVVLTANDDPSLISWALELGALEVLAKPVDARVLGTRLRALLTDAVA